MLTNTYLLRLLWTIVEEMQSQDLLTLSDTALAAVLMQQVSRQVLMSAEEVCRLYEYIGSRVILIRDMADSRQSRSLSPKTESFTLESHSVSCVSIPV